MAVPQHLHTSQWAHPHSARPHRVSSFKITAHDYFAKVWDFFRSAPESSWDSVQVDKVQKMTDDWMKQASEQGILGVSAGENRAIDDMAYEIERGFRVEAERLGGRGRVEQGGVGEW